LIESSFRSSGQVSGTSMTLTGSGTSKANQRVEGGLIANLDCTLTSTAVFARRSQPPPPPPPPPPAPSSGNFQWVRQFGSTGADVATHVATNATGVYVAGYVEGVLPGQTAFGAHD